MLSRRRSAPPTTLRHWSQRRAVIGVAAAAALIAVTGCSNDSSGIDARELIGEWAVVEGASVGARSGAPQDSDHADAAGDFILPNAPAIDWTFRVIDADERGFIGEWCSPRICESLAGAVRRDGTAVMADEDSVLTLSRVDDELELCVVTPGETFQVVACHLLRSR
jgi:hypothetical protein